MWSRESPVFIKMRICLSLEYQGEHGDGFFKRWLCDQRSWQCINAFYFIIKKGHINCNNCAVCAWINVTVGEWDQMYDGYMLQSLSRNKYPRLKLDGEILKQYKGRSLLWFLLASSCNNYLININQARNQTCLSSMILIFLERLQIKGILCDVMVCTTGS